jgi:hypothetical protein
MAFTHTFSYIKGRKQVEETRSLSAGKAIRFKCLDCSGGSSVEVANCHITLCPLWPFRMGKSRPFSVEASERARRQPPGFKKKRVPVEQEEDFQTNDE